MLKNRLWLFCLPALGLCANVEYRNLAVNPNDKHMDVWTPANGYPHVITNNEHPNNPSNLPEFYGLNVIDGKTSNVGHGSSFPSWGPNNMETVPHQLDPNLKIDFGNPKVIDKLVIWIRADFPHDSYWKSATVHFSDNSTLKIKLDSTAAPQTFAISPARVTSYVLFDSLIQSSAKWCGWTEVQVWGADLAKPAAPDSLAAVAPSSTVVKLTWADKSTNEKSFLLQRKTGNGPFVTVKTIGANSTTINDSGLTPATNYVYHLAASNDSGSSANTPDVNVVTAATGVKGMKTQIQKPGFQLVSDRLNVTLPQQASVQLFDINGRSIYKQTFAQSGGISLAHLSNGTYFAQMKYEGVLINDKICIAQKI